VLAGILIAPAVIFIFALVGLPLLLAIWLAFSSATSGSLSGHWVGLANFRNEWDNAIFQRALWNTFWFTVISQVIVVLGAGILAHALIRPFRGRWFLRFLILLPWAAPIALGTIAFQWILDPTFSVFNWVLIHSHTIGTFCSVTGISNCSATSPPNWVGDPTLARISIILVHAWRILPFATVIFIAGIASIPTEVHDAAAIDGATGLKKFWYVSLPLQLPIAIIALLFGIVFTATDMTVAYVLTHGGPFNSTHMLSRVAVPLAGACRRRYRDADRRQAGGGRMSHGLRRFFGPRAIVLPFAIVLAFPFYWMVITAFKKTTELYRLDRVPFWWHDGLTFSNIRDLFENTPYVTWLENTALVGVIVVAITLVVALPAGYALARLSGGWGQTMGVGIFLTYLVPPTLLFLPLSRVISDLHLSNSLGSLILVYPSFTIPFSTWLLMGFFKTIPPELEDAALIDGCSRIQALIRIVFPISLPGILTVVIFSFSLVVNEFIYAITFISSSHNRTLSAGVPTDLIRGDLVLWGGVMAATLIPSIPLALLYNAFLNRFIAGFTGGAFR